MPPSAEPRAMASITCRLASLGALARMADVPPKSRRRGGLWLAVLAAALVLLCALAWAKRDSGPMQALFIYFGLFTGVDVQKLWDPPVHWRVKQTLTIETPQGDVTSSVVRAKVMWKDRLFNTSPSRATGEALVIEVSPGRYLFATIQEIRPNEVKLLFPNDMRLRDSAPKLHTVIGRPVEIPPDEYPLMVTFGDLKDPTSVQEVNPSNLPATFGPGYKIKSYTVEITDEPVTAGRVEALLPWIGDPKVMNNPGWQEIPIDARRRLQGLITDYTGAQKRFLEGNK